MIPFAPAAARRPRHSARRSLFACLAPAALGVGLALAALSAQAQWKPAGTVRLIVPFGPGGATDVLARVAATETNKGGRLGQTMIVENRAGANGLLGAGQVARAAPDGQTLCVCTTGQISVAGLLGEKPQYDPEKDLIPVAGGWSSGLIVMVRPDLPVRNIAEFIAYARANPGKVNMANAGKGSPTHLGAELLRFLANTSWTNVPYPGEADAIRAVAGGFADWYPASVVSPAIGLMKDGRLRAIATFSSRRTVAFPDLPTIAEQGYPGFNSDPISGFNAPAGTPAAAVETLSRELQAALRSETARAAFDKAGMNSIVSDAAAWGALVAADRAKWAKLIREANVKVD